MGSIVDLIPAPRDFSTPLSHVSNTLFGDALNKREIWWFSVIVCTTALNMYPDLALSFSIDDN